MLSKLNLLMLQKDRMLKRLNSSLYRTGLRACRAYMARRFVHGVFQTYFHTAGSADRVVWKGRELGTAEILLF